MGLLFFVLQQTCGAVIRMLNSSWYVLSEFADMCQISLNIASIKYVIIKQCHNISKLQGCCGECKKIT
jgi:hypothetical protein